MSEPDCVCGHLEHEDEDCPEQVRMGGMLHPCGCDDYVPSRFDSTAGSRCPACGSGEHDGWTDNSDCSEDWTVLSKFEARRSIQLICEKWNGR